MTLAPQHRIQVVAHRGASEDAPEHTLAAYMKAIQDGADALECDVRLTADGHLVCVHDRRVNRTSNGRGAVSALELADLAALDFGSWKTHEAWRGRSEEPDWEVSPARPDQPDQPHQPDQSHLPDQSHQPEEQDRPEEQDQPRQPRWSRESQQARQAWQSWRPQPVPEPSEHTSVLTLERLLELIADSGRRVELAVETKHPTRWAGQVEERLLELLKRFGLEAPASAEESPVRVMSFSARSLQRVHAVSATLPTVYLTQFLGPRLRDGRLPAGVRIAGPSIRIVRNNPAFVERMKEAGHQVHVWTVNEPADIDLCVGLGIDAIITNRPRAVLERLGRGGNGSTG